MCISTRLGCFATLMWLAALLLFFALVAWQRQCIEPFVADKVCASAYRLVCLDLS